jgi:GH24 family phage-related lysozyme (muramidase)
MSCEVAMASEHALDITPKRWTHAGGKVLKGLERRREAEAARYHMRWS